MMVKILRKQKTNGGEHVKHMLTSNLMQRTVPEHFSQLFYTIY